MVYRLLGGIMSDKKSSQENIEAGCRLKKVREEMHLTQEAFASKLDISVSAYKKIEGGENGVSTKVLRQLRRMNISSDYILFGEITPVDKIWYEVDNSTAKDKMEIFLRLLLEYTKDEVSGVKLSKSQVVQLISSVFDKG